jgi:hypothetical protein
MHNFKRTLWTIVAGLGLLAAGAAITVAQGPQVQNSSIDVYVIDPVVAGSTFNIDGNIIGQADVLTVTVETGGNGKGNSQKQTITVPLDSTAPAQNFKVTARARGVGNGSLKITAVATSFSTGSVLDAETTTVVSSRGRRR